MKNGNFTIMVGSAEARPYAPISVISLQKEDDADFGQSSSLKAGPNRVAYAPF